MKSLLWPRVVVQANIIGGPVKNERERESSKQHDRRIEDEWLMALAVKNIGPV